MTNLSALVTQNKKGLLTSYVQKLSRLFLRFFFFLTGVTTAIQM